MKPPWYGRGNGGQAVSSPLLECQCDAHWGELDWKISDSGRSQKDLAASELALHSVTHTVQRAQNRREPGGIFVTGMENRYVDRLFLKRLDGDVCKCDHHQDKYMTKDVKNKQTHKQA